MCAMCARVSVSLRVRAAYHFQARQSTRPSPTLCHDGQRLPVCSVHAGYSIILNSGVSSPHLRLLIMHCCLFSISIPAYIKPLFATHTQSVRVRNFLAQHHVNIFHLLSHKNKFKSSKRLLRDSNIVQYM